MARKNKLVWVRMRMSDDESSARENFRRAINKIPRGGVKLNYYIQTVLAWLRRRFNDEIKNKKEWRLYATNKYLSKFIIQFEPIEQFSYIKKISRLSYGKYCQTDTLCLIFYFLNYRTREADGIETSSVKFHVRTQTPWRRYGVEIVRISWIFAPARLRHASHNNPRSRPRKNSGNGIAKRNIPVDFTSTISLRGLNKNISLRSRGNTASRKVKCLHEFLPFPSRRLLLLPFPSERRRVHNPRTRVGSPGPTRIRACRWDHVSDPEESGAFVGVIRKFYLYFSYVSRYEQESWNHIEEATLFSVCLKIINKVLDYL